jgi:hypothetical protein
MSKVVLFAASLLLIAGVASAGVVDPCAQPTIYTYSGPAPGPAGTELDNCYYACPAGDTPAWILQGHRWDFTIEDNLGSPIMGIPNTDFWHIQAAVDYPLYPIVLCGASNATNADTPTDPNGQTSISLDTYRVGGCTDGLKAVCQGYVMQDPNSIPVCQDYVWFVQVRSVDMNGDLLVNVQDLVQFSLYWPPNPYHPCADFNCDESVGVQDLVELSLHYGPPGHFCL